MKKYLFWAFFLLFQASLRAQEVPTYQGKSSLIHSIKDYMAEKQKDSDNGLVNLVAFISPLHVDIRYAGTNNFMHKKMYPLAEAFLRRPAAEALKKVALALNEQGIGLLIYDAYRPYSITVKFYKTVHDSNFVASPRNGSKHNRGCAVDVGLYSLKTGKPLLMPTDFDSFLPKAASNYPNLSQEALSNRALLASTMVKFGFETIKTEWWHFDFKGWKSFSLLDISFQDLETTSN